MSDEGGSSDDRYNSIEDIPDEDRASRVGGYGGRVQFIVSLAVGLIIVPVGIVLMLVWVTLGVILTTDVPVLAAIFSVLSIILYFSGAESHGLGDFLDKDVGDASFDTSLFDVPLVLLFSTGMLVWLYEKYSNPHVDRQLLITEPVDQLQPFGYAVALFIVNLSYVIVKSSVFTRDESAFDDAKGIYRLVLVESAMASFFLMVAVSRVWQPTSTSQLVLAESKLLALGGAHCRTSTVAGIHGVEAPFQASAQTSKSLYPPLVILHGYGLGAPLWFKNLSGLSEHFHVYSLDWLGIGLSDRPTFKKSMGAEASEAFFVDALERWRAAQGLDQMLLMGHSLGGILAASYALRFPQHVQLLLLASPATPPPIREHPLVAWGWRHNGTPMMVMRWLGPLGRKLVEGFVSTRYYYLPPLETAALVAYTFQNWAGAASGEYALNGVMQPGASARLKLEHRLLPGAIKVPLVFLYGGAEEDWMDAAVGERIVSKLRALQHNGISPAVYTECLRVPRASHNLNVHRPAAFNSTVALAWSRAQASAAKGFNIGGGVGGSTSTSGVGIGVGGAGAVVAVEEESESDGEGSGQEGLGGVFVVQGPSAAVGLGKSVHVSKEEEEYDDGGAGAAVEAAQLRRRERNGGGGGAVGSGGEDDLLPEDDVVVQQSSPDNADHHADHL